MTDAPNTIIHNGLVAPGVLRLSTEALNYARQFIEAVTAAHGDGNMAMFAWVDLQTSKTGPDAPTQIVRNFLDLGAISRSEIPPDAVQTLDGLDFAIQIPSEVVQKSVQRLIDLDENAYSRLVLK